MSNVVFTTSAANRLAAQPLVSTVIVLRSTDATDAMDATVYGTVSAAPDTSLKALTGQVEVVTADAFTAITHATLDGNPTGTVTGLAAGTAAIGDITALLNPSDGDTLTIGLTGNTRAYRFKSTLASAYDVQIGATATDTMLSFKRAINADGTAGVDYYAGTLANPLLSGAVNTTVLTLTDRIACDRQLDWTFTESASNFAKRVPTGGVDGLTLFSIGPSYVSAADPLTFSSEGHSVATLPALMTGFSPPVAIGGDPAMIRIWSSQAITIFFENSTDQVNWHPSSEGAIAISANTLTNIMVAELYEFMRFSVTSNVNTTDTILDARVIY